MPTPRCTHNIFNPSTTSIARVVFDLSVKFQLGILKLCECIEAKDFLMKERGRQTDVQRETETDRDTGADPGIYLGGGPKQGPQSKVKGEARIEGAIEAIAPEN